MAAQYHAPTTLLHRLVLLSSPFALFTQCPGDTVQTGPGKVDPVRKFKCTTAARDLIDICSNRAQYTVVQKMGTLLE